MPGVPKRDGYEFLERLGGGCFAEVCKARDKTLDRLCAVKILRHEQ